MPPGVLPNPGTEPGLPTLQADSLPSSHQGSLQAIAASVLLQVDLTKPSGHHETLLHSQEKLYRLAHFSVEGLKEK